MTDHALYVSFRQSGEYLTLSAQTMEWAGDSIRNLRAESYDPDPFAGIVATAQADNRRDDVGRDFSYAWRLGFQTDSYDVAPIASVAATLATLRRAERRLDKLAETLGPAGTFGSYVARLAAVLDVPIVFGASGPDGMYSSGEYRVASAASAVSTIDSWIIAHRAGRAVAA